jgi:hypothetical protein
MLTQHHQPKHHPLGLPQSSCSLQLAAAAAAAAAAALLWDAWNVWRFFWILSWFTGLRL